MKNNQEGSATGLARVLDWTRRRLRARPDTEHMMGLNRVVFCAVFAVFLVALHTDHYQAGLIAVAVEVVATAAIFGHILYAPAPNSWRRLVAIVADMSAICYEMHLGGAATSVVYPLILWTAFGNGLRFGLPWLLRATFVGVACFSGVVATTSFWQQYPSLTAGLLLALIILPLYAVVLLRNLSAAKLQAEAASEAKTLFLARVSHELRTPLHAIIGTGSLLETTQLTREQEDMSRTIMDAGHSLLALIEDLLKTASIESGKFPFNVAALDTIDLLSEVRSLVQVSARTKGLRVAIHVAHGTPDRVLSDQRRLREILLNLAGNALKFTSVGGVLLSVAQVARAGAQARLRFEVVDTGIGIPASAHEAIFARFAQADASIHDRFGGTGLGLAICKQLVETMGGRIGVKSEPGAGSVFWFEIDCQSLPSGQDVQNERPGEVIAFDLDAGSRRAAETLAEKWNAPVRHERADATAIHRALVASAKEGGPIVIFSAEDPTLSGIVASTIKDIRSDRLPALMAVGGQPAAPDTDLRWVAPTAIPRGLASEEMLVAANIALTLARGHRGVVDKREAVTVHRPSRHILVVDDSRINQQVIARILASGGHTYELVADGESALDALETERFDLVLMDVNMQGMDGIETTKLYRFTALGRPHVPIMALTADATPEMAQRCMDAGMDRCIIKPVHADTMLAIIDSIAAPPSAAQAASEGAERSATAIVKPALLPLRPDIAVFDTAHLESLRSLGGQEFVSQLIEDFATDARALVEGLLDAVEHDDISSFRANSHALASASGNLGAARIRQLGLAMERFSAEEFGSHGLLKALELEREVGCLRQAATSGRLEVS
jgi:two-component system sensor histidine kinase RpfC